MLLSDQVHLLVVSRPRRMIDWKALRLVVLASLVLLLAFQVLACTHVCPCPTRIVLSMGWLVGPEFHLASLALAVLPVFDVETSLLGGGRSDLFFASIHLILACLLYRYIFYLDLDPFVGFKSIQVLSQSYPLV